MELKETQLITPETRLKVLVMVIKAPKATGVAVTMVVVAVEPEPVGHQVMDLALDILDSKISTELAQTSITAAAVAEERGAARLAVVEMEAAALDQLEIPVLRPEAQIPEAVAAVLAVRVVIPVEAAVQEL